MDAAGYRKIEENSPISQPFCWAATETIGDAYMGVTNLLGNQDDSHVKRVAEFAIEMVKEANKILIDDEVPVRHSLVSLNAQHKKHSH